MTTNSTLGGTRGRRRRPPDAFTEFANEAGPRLVRSAQLFLGDRASAEDAAQTALLRVFRRWDAIVSNPSSYAASVLVNVCRDVLRRRARTPETPSNVASFELAVPVSAPEVGERLAVHAALVDLPQLQREVVVLRYLLDLSVADAASALGVPEGTVKSATSRAFDRLRLVLSPDHEEAHRAH